MVAYDSPELNLLTCKVSSLKTAALLLALVCTRCVLHNFAATQKRLFMMNHGIFEISQALNQLD